MKKTEELKINDELTTTVEISGPSDAQECIIFSHGFGVRRDVRGLFSDLVQELSQTYRCIQFEYNQVGEQGNLYVGTVSSMQETLRAVSNTYRLDTTHAVGHSLGCILVSQQQELFSGRIMLLAPPLQPLGDRLEKYLRARPDTNVLENGDLHAARSDGSVTHVSRSFFDELHTIEDPVLLYTKIENKLSIVVANQDDVVGYHPESAREVSGVQVFEVDSDHDLTGPVRKKLLDLFESMNN